MINRDRLVLLFTAGLLVAGFIITAVVILLRPSSSIQSRLQESVIAPNRPASSIINYEKGTQVKLFEKLTGERNLAGADLQARSKITSSLPEKSGTLLTTSNVRLDYLSTPDFFQAEILSADAALAKKETVGWLLSQGISQAGICELPIMFFLGQTPAEEFIKSRNTFSPLAPGC